LNYLINEKLTLISPHNILQIGTGYNLTRNELVKKLRVAALRSMS